MKFIVDMNLSPDWATYLSAVGFASVHWLQVGAADATDSEIMSWARASDHIVLTSDLDFGRLLSLTRAPAPSVVQIRSGNLMPTHIGQDIVAAILNGRDALASGALLTINRARSKLRVLPFASTDNE